MYKHDNKKSDNSQELIDKTLKKLMLKKVNKKKIIDWLLREKEIIYLIARLTSVLRSIITLRI